MTPWKWHKVDNTLFARYKRRPMLHPVTLSNATRQAFELSVHRSTNFAQSVGCWKTALTPKRPETYLKPWDNLWAYGSTVGNFFSAGALSSCTAHVPIF